MSKFRYAIIGAASISNKFAEAVALLPDACVCAIAARDLSRAQAFADRHGIPAAYGDYEEMLIKEKPDGVYIGVVTSKHFELTMLCLKHKIPVICEKAMFTDLKQARECFEYAKEQKTFCMEAMWSRFLPAILKAKSWIEEGKIGNVRYITCNIGWTCEVDMNNRFYSKELGGGAAYDLLVYSYELATFMHPAEIVKKQLVAEFAPTGVDTLSQVSLKFSDGVIASLCASINTVLEEALVICGDKGFIRVPCAHFAWEAYLHDSGRQVVEHFVDSVTKNGFTYEAQELIDCVKAGKLESEVIPHSETLASCEIYDMIFEGKNEI